MSGKTPSGIGLGLVLVMGLASGVAKGDGREGGTLGSVTKESWGRLPDGQSAHLYTLKNAAGMTIKVTDYGGIIVSLTAPDRNGKFADIVLGYDTLDAYVANNPYFGAAIGRYGNRIAGGRFTVDGKSCTLETNNEPGGIPCHLHGGVKGFDKVMWDVEAIVRDGAVGLKLHHMSPDGAGGYPGNLDVTMHYWLSDDNALRIEFEATTDQATPVNLTNHSYFNLGGHDSGAILNHDLMIRADHITAVDKGLIPTGEMMSVDGTPFDFRTPTAIGKRIGVDDAQLKVGPGYDHNFVLSRWDGKLRSAVIVHEPRSGRTLEIETTEPGIQFYSGNFLDGSNVGKGGHAYLYRTGFCLEPQHYPDSPNQPSFPSTILRPDERYSHTSVYRFTAK
ncbi:MAG TPA: aldose epimerase family protein [Phycisphaerae bacterium]|nr:aldose epimerase family protein [Phycisphaerae bacterium]HRW53535.1 aldose epimerase family protein [Phycisphaerae bacterium]